ncbi:hypothetical protein BGZ63DRAFT_393433 [Mariannaea sp. PMI_226]|nr:hypothetical protein BGZ63DRAFT_393433 [Mariannaea sp. PMI_226]
MCWNGETHWALDPERLSSDYYSISTPTSPHIGHAGPSSLCLFYRFRLSLRMADPLSIAASLVAVVTAAITSTVSLIDTVKRFKGRNKTLQRLQEELEDLSSVLKALKDSIGADISILALLESPVKRCDQVCYEFEKAMQEFSGKPKASILDWAKMEFRRDNINGFLDTLAGYKSTIAVGLGTINLHTSRVSHQVLKEYGEIIKDTAYNLKIHLQRIDEEIEQLPAETPGNSNFNIDLEDEKAITEQCLRICEDAKAHIDSLNNREPSLQYGTSSSSTASETRRQFEAQLLTRQVLNDNRDSFARTIGHLRSRLESLTLDGSPGRDEERKRLMEDINISKQCLEVCKMASDEASQKKSYIVGEAIAEGESDQLVVTTLADLFDVKKAFSRGGSAQLIGSMTDESLQQLTAQRYQSKFGAAQSDKASSITSPSTLQTRETTHSWLLPQSNRMDQMLDPEAGNFKPSPNEMRKRTG